MSIIGEVNKLAAMEREIDSIEMLIVFVSSLTVDDLAKVLPRVATKALETSSSAAEERLAH